MAETYNIYDYRKHPARLISTLTAGLRDDSRVKMAYAKTNVSPNTLLLARAVDNLSLLVWAKSKDAQNGTNKPDSIVARLLNANKEDGSTSFKTPHEFEMARAKILERSNKNGS